MIANCAHCSQYQPLLGGLCPACYVLPAARANRFTVERMLEVLCTHVGAARGISIGELVLAMAHPLRISEDERASVERSARDLVVQLRLDGHHVCSHPSSGYFMAADAAELDAACQFLYERAMTSLTQVAAMRRVSLPDLRGQLQLPT